MTKEATARRANVPEHVAHSVEALATLHERAQKGVSRHQRAIEVLTATLGRPGSVYFIGTSVASWIAYNLIAPHVGLRRLDEPPFFWLQGALCLGSLFMTAMVLTTQNRQTRHAEQRAQLDLHVNLITEQKIAKLIDLVEELRRDMPTVKNRVDPLADAMKHAVDPHAVISALEDTLEPAAGEARTVRDTSA